MSKKNVIRKIANMRISKISNVIKISALLWFIVNCSNSSIENDNIKSSEKLLGGHPKDNTNNQSSSGMSQNYESLEFLQNISDWNTNNVTDWNTNNVTDWNTNNVTDWNTNNVTDWNTNNVTDWNTNMSYIFAGLTSLPDISNWNTSNVTNMSSMFQNCTSLGSLSGISNWNTSNVTNMNGMFQNCSSLTSLPDISNWNTNNIPDMNHQ
jgi:surface protein